MKPRVFKAHRDFYGIRYLDTKLGKRVIYADSLREAMDLVKYGYREGYIAKTETGAAR